MNQSFRFDGSAETVDVSLYTLLSSYGRLVALESDRLSRVESVLPICTAIQSAARGLKASLRRQWNTRQPVYLLPNELLHDILHEALEYDRPHYRPGRPPNYLLRQQALRRVSSHWNQVILSSPQFWNTLSCVDLPRKRFGIALERSRDSGLNLICRSTDFCQDFVARMILLSHRWVSLDISFAPIWEQFSSLPNSGLRHLTINFLTQTVTQLPQPSKLQSLTMVESCRDMAWSQIAGTIGNGLRSLELQTVFDLDTATLLGLIAASPALERLKVIETPLHNYKSVILRKVSAPSLRYFWLAARYHIPDIFDLLANISMPATTSVHLKLTEAPYSPVSLHPTVQKLFRFLCDRIQMLDEDCSVQVRSRDKGEIAFTCAQVDIYLLVDRPRALRDSTHAETSDILEPVMRGQRELDLSETGAGKYFVSSIFLLFGFKLPGLSRLAISNSPEFLKLLIWPQGKGRWVFPGLQHLRIVGGEWEPLLLDLVRARRYEPAVCTIESVVLQNVDVNEACLDWLRCYVNEASILN